VVVEDRAGNRRAQLFRERRRVDRTLGPHVDQSGNRQLGVGGGPRPEPRFEQPAHLGRVETAGAPHAGKGTRDGEGGLGALGQVRAAAGRRNANREGVRGPLPPTRGEIGDDRGAERRRDGQPTHQRGDPKEETRRRIVSQRQIDGASPLRFHVGLTASKSERAGRGRPPSRCRRGWSKRRISASLWVAIITVTPSLFISSNR